MVECFQNVSTTFLHLQKHYQEHFLPTKHRGSLYKTLPNIMISQINQNWLDIINWWQIIN